jgi:hypothetical protein
MRSGVKKQSAISYQRRQNPTTDKLGLYGSKKLRGMPKLPKIAEIETQYR